MALYSNAVAVLPPDLLNEVQKHWHGGYLWVPRRDKMQQREMILTAIRSGLSAEDVAVLGDITVSQVYRLALKLGQANPYLQKSKREQAQKSDSPTTAQ